MITNKPATIKHPKELMLFDTNSNGFSREFEVDWHMYIDTYIEETTFSLFSLEYDALITVIHRKSSCVRRMSEICIKGETLKNSEKFEQYLKDIGSFYLSQTNFDKEQLEIKQTKPSIFRSKRFKEKIYNLKKEYHQPVFSKVIDIDSLFRTIKKHNLPFSSQRATDLFHFCVQTCAEKNIVLGEKDIRITTIKELYLNTTHENIHSAEMIQEVNFFDSLYITFRVWQSVKWFYQPIEIRRV